MRISKFLYPPSIARCQHVKVNGVQCGSPALKSRKLCHFHQRWQQGRIQLNANHARRSRYSLDLPILEDANSIQVALMQGMRLLLTNQVDHRTAALLFYALQTASSNLSRTTFEPRPQQVVIDPSSIADTSLGDDAWYKEEFTQDEDDQEEAPADIHATINLQAMAASGPVGDLRRRAVSGFVSADSHRGDSHQWDSSQGDSRQGDSYQGTSSDVPQCRITNAPSGAAFRARAEPTLRPNPVGRNDSQPSRPRTRAVGFTSTRNPETPYKMMSYEDEACGANHWSVSDRPGSHAVGGSAGG
jgi:hypothetical protein